MQIFRTFPLLVCLAVVACDERDKPAATSSTAAEGENRAETKRERDLSLEEQREARQSRRKELKKATGLATPEERNRKIAQTVWDSLELDPELAREAFTQLLPGSEERNRLIQHFATTMAEENVAEASKWAAQLETEEEKSLAYGNIASAMADEDPEGAARLLSDTGVEGREINVAIVEVVDSWSEKSPADAANWVVKFDSGEARSAGLKAVTARWMAGDPESAVSWIASLGNESLKKDAADAFAEVVLEGPDIVQQIMMKSATPEMVASYETLKAKAEAEALKIQAEESGDAPEN